MFSETFQNCVLLGVFINFNPKNIRLRQTQPDTFKKKIF